MTRFSAAACRTGASALLVIAAGLGTATLAEAAPAAPATPSGCTNQTYGFGNRVYCSGGSGQYRATVRCDVNNGFDYNRYGSWVGAARWSFADCDSGDRPFNPGMQIR